MITVGYDGDNNKVVLSLAGCVKFEEMIAACRKYGLTFKKHLETGQGVWKNVYVMTPEKAELALPELQKIERFSFDLEEMGVESTTPLPPETEFVRRALVPECFREPPIEEFQREDVKKLICQNRYYLALTMGLGKSYIVITAMNHYFHYGVIDRLLCVVPIEGFYNFRNELLKFSTFARSEDRIYMADADHRDPFLPDVPVTIMTYSTLRLISEDYYYKKHPVRTKTGTDGKEHKKKPSPRKPILPFSEWGRMGLICDEAHALGNPASSQTKMVSLLKKDARCIYLLSGTPAPNRVSQWYPQVKLLDGSLVNRSYADWLLDIAVLGTKFSEWAVKYFKPDKVAAFLKKIEPWIIRRFDGVDLPPLVEEPVYLGLTPKHRELYQAFVEYALNVIKKENDGRIIAYKVKEKFPYLSQAIDDPCLLQEKIDPDFSPTLFNLIKRWKFEDNSKMEIVDSLVEKYVDAQGKKTIIWGGHPGSLDRLAEHFKARRPIVIHGQRASAYTKDGMREGSNSPAGREPMLDLFRQSEEHNLLIASYLVLSTSINLVESSRMIYWDRSFDLKYWLQSQKRSHRIGQTDTVFLNPLIIEGSLSMIQDRMLRNRMDLNRFMFDRDSLPIGKWKQIFLGHLSDEDLTELGEEEASRAYQRASDLYFKDRL